MKKVLVIIAVVGFAGFAMASTIGSDNASNAAYSGGWTNGSNGGSGFQAWSISTSGTAGSFIGDPVAQGFGNIGAAGFAMWANPNGPGNSINADRLFAGGALNNQIFNIELATAYRNGNKGLDLDVAGVSAWNFNVGSDQYQVGGSDLGWTYAQDSIFTIAAYQSSATALSVTLTQSSAGTPAANTSQVFSVTTTAALDGFGLYNSDTDAGNDLNNFYANDMSIAVPEPMSAALLGLGIGVIYLFRKRVKK